MYRFRELADLSETLQQFAIRGMNIFRCRVYPEESWFAYTERLDGLGKPVCTAPQYIKNWGKPIGYGHLCIEPARHEVYGMALPTYVLQATKGLREGAAQEWLWTMEMEQIKPALPPICEVMDNQGIDRIYLTRFQAEEQIGEGYGYVMRRLEGQPCQHKHLFKGSNLYSVGLVSLARTGEAPKAEIFAADWQAKHLVALDDVLKQAGLEPTVGYAGGPRETKAPLREQFRRAFAGITAIPQC